MKSQTRQDCEAAVKEFATIMNASRTEKGKLLYVGVAGDPKGGEYAPLFTSYESKTLDFDPVWEPDIVGDITDTAFISETWEAIVCVQVLEHIPNVWDLPEEIERILVRGGYAIVDCPWNYPYHAEPPSFGDYWRISKDGFAQLFNCPNLSVERIIATDHNTSCLIRKL